MCDLAWDKYDRDATLVLSGGRSVLSLKGNEERKLITSHFSSLYHTFLPFITLSLFFLFVSLHPQALIYCLLASFTHPLPSILSLSNIFPATPYDSPSVCLHVSFQSINGAYMLHDTVHGNIRSSWCFPGTSSQPGISLRIYVVPFCSALWGKLEHRGQCRKRMGKKGKTERIETRLPSKCQPLMCMMVAFGYKLTERAYPCMCGVELWLSCLSIYVSHCAYRHKCLWCSRSRLQIPIRTSHW